nr:cytochrome p450 [Quercus suber]
MVCKHPVVQLKIAKVAKEATNMKEITNYAEFVASISEEALEKMQYLHAEITETLRLYPVVLVVMKFDYVYCQHFIVAYEILHVFSSIFHLRDEYVLCA